MFYDWSVLVNLKSILFFCENAVFYDGFGPWSILIVFFKKKNQGASRLTEISSVPGGKTIKIDRAQTIVKHCVFAKTKIDQRLIKIDQGPKPS